MAHVKVTIEVKDANGKDCLVTQQKSILAGDIIPTVIENTATKAARLAWERLNGPKPNITYSAEAVVERSSRHYSAFQRNSYIARVEFNEVDYVIVVLPKNARRFPTNDWTPRVLEWANVTRDNGGEITIMSDSVKP